MYSGSPETSRKSSPRGTRELKDRIRPSETFGLGHVAAEDRGRLLLALAEGLAVGEEEDRLHELGGGGFGHREQDVAEIKEKLAYVVEGGGSPFHRARRRS